jgi:hypothetical protein
MPRRKTDNDSPPVELAPAPDLPEVEPPAPPPAAPVPPAAAPAPAALAAGFTFVLVSAARGFLRAVTIPNNEPPITVGATASGPNGFGLLAFRGTLYSHVGDFALDPAHPDLFGFPVYVEVP